MKKLRIIRKVLSKLRAYRSKLKPPECDYD
jgi:hypothetical protein